MINVLIAHFNPQAVSGAELAILETVREDRGVFRYRHLVPGSGPLERHYHSLNLDLWVFPLQTRRRRYPGLHTLQSAFVSRRLKREDVRAVICNTFPAAARIATAATMAQIPYGIYVREYIRKIPLHVSMLRRANRVFAVSRDVGSYLADVVPAERMRVCHDAIDAGAVVRRAAAVGMATPGLLPFDEHPLVGYVGRLTSYKQPELFLRAAARIARAKPSTRFLVVGGEGPNETGYSDRLMRLAGELGICDALSFLGHRRDALHIIRRLAVLCVTSDREPFPRTILEAQVLGVPVVAPSTGGCPEMIRHGVNGLLFGAPNEHADQRLAEAVSSLLDDTDLAKRIGHRAAADVRVSFGGDGPVRYFEHCLEELVGIVGPSRKSVPV